MATTGSTSSKPTKTEQSLFEEDDEFEEFPTEGECRDIIMDTYRRQSALIPIKAHPCKKKLCNCVFSFAPYLLFLSGECGITVTVYGEIFVL